VFSFVISLLGGLPSIRLCHKALTQVEEFLSKGSDGERERQVLFSLIRARSPKCALTSCSPRKGLDADQHNHIQYPCSTTTSGSHSPYSSGLNCILSLTRSLLCRWAVRKGSFSPSPILAMVYYIKPDTGDIPSEAQSALSGNHTRSMRSWTAQIETRSFLKKLTEDEQVVSRLMQPAVSGS
jgi:hypothetical protein